MRKFHCPYCGKRCIPFHFKFRLRPVASEVHRYFRCPECKNNLHKTTGTKGKKYLTVIEILLFIEVLLLPVSLLVGSKALLFIQLGIFAITTASMSIIHYYFFEFTTELSNYFDYTAEVELMDKSILKVGHMTTGKIYTLKPIFEAEPASQFAKRYLVAIKSSHRIKKDFYRSRIRFIQPKVFVTCEKSADTSFYLFDGDKLIARGVFRDKKPEKVLMRQQSVDLG